MRDHYRWEAIGACLEVLLDESGTDGVECCGYDQISGECKEFLT